MFWADYEARGHVTTATSSVRCGEPGRQECQRGPNEVLIRPESLAAGHLTTIWGPGCNGGLRRSAATAPLSADTSAPLIWKRVAFCWTISKKFSHSQMVL